MHLLCRRQLKQFQAWEEGRGPCLPPPEATDAATPASTNEPSGSPPAGPGLAQRAINFGRAVVRHMADQGKQVTDGEYEARLAVCRNCELCDLEKMVCKHPSCGCFLNIKARWHSERCPLDKWPSLSNDTPADH